MERHNPHKQKLLSILIFFKSVKEFLRPKSFRTAVLDRSFFSFPPAPLR